MVKPGEPPATASWHMVGSARLIYQLESPAWRGSLAQLGERQLLPGWFSVMGAELKAAAVQVEYQLCAPLEVRCPWFPGR